MVLKNGYAALSLFGALIIGVVVAGQLSAGLRGTFGRYFFYTVGACLTTIDLIVRASVWYFQVERARKRTQVNRDGTRSIPARRPRREVLQALFGHDTGGHFFFVLPAWVAGIGVAVLYWMWQKGWIPKT